VIPHLDIPVSTLIWALAGAFCLGFAKTGLPGLALLNVVVMAHFFGKESVGIVLPLLIFADIVVFPIYRRHATWREAWPLLIPSIVGVCLGYFVLRSLDDLMTKRVIGWTILGMLVLQFLRMRSESFLTHLPHSRRFLAVSGLAIGVSTTVANAAGPVFSIWALLKGLPKEQFLGIGARVFLFLNIFKIPFNWEIGILNPRTLWLDVALVPSVLLGIAAGKPLVARIPQEIFVRILFALSGAGALWLILT
jgi:uncharacterized membrane protein YfcA